MGGKAWSLARMTSLGLPVPPAFVVTTDGFRHFHETGGVSATLRDEVLAGVARLEEESGRRFGSGPNPLLISVRSGAAISMPGMMDTVLNLGMTDEVEAALAAESGDDAFARDTHHRFLDLFTDVVLNRDPRDHPGDSPAAVRASVNRAVPDVGWDPESQLMASVEAVFRSWNSRRALRYRAHQGIPDDLGTAVTVQAMVFGNLGEDSGTGVLFSRNPLDGTNEVFGEYLRRAQGEDVVSGRVTPQRLSDLEDQDPELHSQLLQAARDLEHANREIQDVEFTVQGGRLFLLQSRTAKLAPEAALQTSIDMVAEGLLTKREALRRLSPGQAQSLVAPRLDANAPAGEPLATGESACAGVGTGTVVDDPDRAVALAAEGKRVVLARPTTSPEDLPGMLAATAVVTDEGGSTSHAAVVSRALGLPCIVGAGRGALADHVGTDVTVDAASGAVYAGTLPVFVPKEDDSPGLRTVIAWAREHSPIDVTPDADGLNDGDLVDLSELSGGSDPERVADLIAGLSGVTAICGGASASPDAVAAAIDAGVRRIVTDPVLPALLAAVQHGPATD
ncbi:pyruvate, phosphate dikinase [Nocardioides rotundus]|nr:pyruvate, phosphate dikinase [Nocardioides rotundus]